MADLAVQYASTSQAAGAAELTQHVTRGVCRSLNDLGYAVLTEFTLRNGRRVDVMGLGHDGVLLAAEVKVSTVDLQGDRKWPEYLPYCDAFYFAVHAGFPLEQIPEECGLIVGDAYGAEILRPADIRPLHASRRKSMVVRFARVAADRLRLTQDQRLEY